MINYFKETFIFIIMDILTVSQFCKFIKNIIPGKKFTVIGEVNQLKNSHGHIFFSFKDNENCLSATIWKSKAELLGDFKIIEGDKITVEGRLDFYSANGKLNFIVDKVITNDGIGELQKKYDKIKEEFFKRGYFDANIKRKIGKTIKNILVLTSETGAAYHDFLYGLENSGSKVNIDLIDVIVQGSDCPKNICIKMEEIKKSDKIYDLVVITRGGGSFQDLFGFSQPELIEAIHNFHLPVISAIGHQVDNPLSDLVADYTEPTPSLAAQFIVDYNRNYLKKLLKIPQELNNSLSMLIINQIQMLNGLNARLLNFENEMKSDLVTEIHNYLRRLKVFDEKINLKFLGIKGDLVSEIHNYLRRLEALNSKLLNFESKDIILNGNGKLFQNSQELRDYTGKKMEIIWNDVILKVSILEKN